MDLFQELDEFFDKAMIEASLLIKGRAPDNMEDLALARNAKLFLKSYMIRKLEKDLCKVVEYDELIYPQYENKFKKEIDKKTWEKLKAEAVCSYEKYKARNCHGAADNVAEHWRKIVEEDFVPFGYVVVDKVKE